MDLSPQQADVVEAVTKAVREPKTPVRHFCIQACAGSGKTRTLLGVVESVLREQPQARILLLAFVQAGGTGQPVPVPQQGHGLGAPKATEPRGRRCGRAHHPCLRAPAV